MPKKAAFLMACFCLSILSCGGYDSPDFPENKPETLPVAEIPEVTPIEVDSGEDGAMYFHLPLDRVTCLTDGSGDTTCDFEENPVFAECIIYYYVMCIVSYNGLDCKVGCIYPYDGLIQPPPPGRG